MGSDNQFPEGPGDRLDSWKAIADHLGREVRTIQRWERDRRLPVHRVPGDRGGVFAYTAELDRWLRGHSFDGNPPAIATGPDAPLAGTTVESAAGPVSGARLSPRSPRPGARKLLALAAAVVLIVAFAAYFARRWSRPVPTPHTGRVMLAVLPFVNLSGDPAQDYFADGLTEEMITDLGRLDPKALGVIARTSAMKYKSTTEDVRQIGRELGVTYILEGSVRREGGVARISAQLIQVSDQTHVWAQNYERQVTDILSVQREVAEAIAATTRIHLNREQWARLIPSKPANPEAYDDYLRGLYFWNRRTGDGLAEGAKSFTRAIQEDPNYAPAYAGLAQCYTLIGLANDQLRQDDAPKALAAALKAIALDDSSAEAHTALAGIKVFYHYDWPGAQSEFQRALQLNPNYAPAQHWYANLYLDPQGRFAEAIAAMKLAHQLDPTNLIIYSDLGQSYFFAREYDKALEIYRRVLEMDPDFAPVHWYLSDTYHELGMQDDEVRELVTGAAWPSPDRRALLHAHATGGYHGFLLAFLRQIHPLSAREEYLPIQAVAAYLSLGDQPHALAALEAAYQHRTPNLIYLNVFPAWDSLHSTPRFQTLARQMTLLPPPPPPGAAH